MKKLTPLAILLAVATTAVQGLAVTNNVGLPRYPSVSPDGSQVVFTWRGDLWRVNTAGGEATRLTVNPQDDNFSIWSPDGKQIAFTSERIGGGNLFTMNVDGTDVKQVTQTDRYLTVLGWNNEGLIVHARLEQDWFPSLRSYAIPAAGGEPTRLFDAFGSYPAVSPDGTKVVFTRGTVSWSRRNYKGSDARELWLYDRTTKTYKQLTNWPGNDGRGKWLDNSTVIFASDREDETVNLYALKIDQADAQPRRLTVQKGVDVEDFDVSRDGKTVVYASWDRLYRLNPAVDSGTTPNFSPIDIDAEEDVGTRTQFRAVDRAVSVSALSPDGKTMAVIAYGQVYVRGVENKSATRRVSPTLARATDLAWSVDGQTLYYTSDANGTPAIFAASVTLSRSDVKKAIEEASKPATRPARRSRSAATTGASDASDEPVVQPTSEPTTEPANDDPTTPPSTAGSTTGPTSGPTSSPATTQASDVKREDAARWADALRFDVKPLIATAETNTNVDPSPDGKSLAFERGQGQLWIYDLASKSERKLVDGWSGGLHWRWSPDSKHIAYSTEDLNNNADVFIVPADGSRAPVNITRHPDNDTSPRWSADGKILAFLSQRNDNEADVYTVILDKDVAALSGADLDQYYKDAGDRAKRRPRPTTRRSTTGPTTSTAEATTRPAAKETLDLEDAYLRVRRMTSLPGSEGDLELLPAGDKLIFTGRFGGSSGPAATPGAPATPAEATARANAGRATLVLDRDSNDPRRLGSAVNIQGLTFEGDKLIVVDSSRAATMSVTSGTLDYSDISDRLAIDVETFTTNKFTEAARTLGAIYYDAKMNGLDWPAVTKRYLDLVRPTRTPNEFDHVANRLLGELNGSHLGISAPDLANPDAITTGRLGIRTTRTADGYRVTGLVEGGPAFDGAMRLRVDDVITAIEGDPIGANETLDGKLVNRVGKESLITVTRGGKETQLLITPISFESEADLSYDQWRKDIAKKVDELSGGKLGYIHIKGMNQPSLDTFERDLFAAADGKQGLLIDVRNNGGGSTTDLLLGSIMYPRHAYTIPRGYGGDVKDNYPQDRLYIQRYNLPINLLCNEKSFSNAEIFSHAFKTLKRGTLVGQQTAGGVISTGGTTLLDGTTVRLPNRGWYTLDGKNMELNGAMPDLLVPQTPEAESSSNDEQLKAAVDDLLKRLGK